MPALGRFKLAFDPVLVATHRQLLLLLRRGAVLLEINLNSHVIADHRIVQILDELVHRRHVIFGAEHAAGPSIQWTVEGGDVFVHQ